MQGNVTYKSERDIAAKPKDHSAYVEAFELMAERYGALDCIPDPIETGLLRFTFLFTDEGKHAQFDSHVVAPPRSPPVIARFSCDPRCLAGVFGALQEVLDENEVFREEIVFLPRHSSKTKQIHLLAKSDSVADCFMEQASLMFKNGWKEHVYSHRHHEQLALRGHGIMNKALWPAVKGPV